MQKGDDYLKHTQIRIIEFKYMLLAILATCHLNLVPQLANSNSTIQIWSHTAYSWMISIFKINLKV